jgi:hypothetical protein
VAADPDYGFAATLTLLMILTNSGKKERKIDVKISRGKFELSALH